jgi:hypothetical protein
MMATPPRKRRLNPAHRQSSAIRKSSRRWQRSLKECRKNWDLADLIEVGKALALIEANTANQARLAKNFRNLIHPGRAQRTNEVCGRATALTALAAAELVVRDLS